MWFGNQTLTFCFSLCIYQFVLWGFERNHGEYTTPLKCIERLLILCFLWSFISDWESHMKVKSTSLYGKNTNVFSHFQAVPNTIVWSSQDIYTYTTCGRTDLQRCWEHTDSAGFDITGGSSDFWKEDSFSCSVMKLIGSLNLGAWVQLFRC